MLTTYALLPRDEEQLREHIYHLVILDESHYIKNTRSKAAQSAGLLNSRHRLCLTGTPLENHLGELWAQFDWLMPGFLGDQRSFAARWRKPIEENGETVRAALLAQRVRPFILRRRKQDVATELPPRTEVIQRVQLQGRQRELYESVRVAADKQVRRVLQRQSFNGAQISILDALLKLRQVCCDPRLLPLDSAKQIKHSAKLEHLMEQNKQLAQPDIPEEPAEQESEGQTRRGPQQQGQDGLSKSKKQPGRASGSKPLFGFIPAMFDWPASSTTS